MSYGLHWYITKLCVAKQHWLERAHIKTPPKVPPAVETDHMYKPILALVISSAARYSTNATEASTDRDFGAFYKL